MGTRKRAGKPKHNVRTTGNITIRTIKRDELDIIASICGTTRDTTGEVQRLTSTNNEYDDGAAERAASESTTVDSDTTSTTTV